jgi:SagB-type dehydrogenase family enzyme
VNSPSVPEERAAAGPALLLVFGEGVELVELDLQREPSVPGAGQLIVRTAAQELALPAPAAGIAAALRRLARGGATEEEIAGLVLGAGGPGDLPVLYYLLAELGKRGLLAHRAAGERGPLATAALTAPGIAFRGRQAEDRQPYVLSRFACMRRRGERMIVESPLAAARVTIDDPRAGALCLLLATPRCLEDLAGAGCGLSPAELGVLCALLLSCRVLAAADGSGQAAEEETGALAYWEFADLLLHGNSRLGRRGPSSGEGFGGTYRFAGSREPQPANKPPMSNEAVDLWRPDLERLRLEDITLTAALEDRRSRRSFGEPPLTLRQLGELLYRTARQRRVFAGEKADELGSRPYPGGGAVYELEIYLSVGACEGLTPGLYHYGPLEHRLWRLAGSPEAVAALLRDAARCALQPAAPQVLVTIAARFARIFWKYEAMGYALILKDVGVLLQTMCLVAEAMGLAACALGVGNADLFAAAAGVDYHEESSVGELMLGSRA